MAEQTTIIPVAGGKGGVGKTFVTANLAVALAQHGHRTIAVDLDLGNSNLHSLLGFENRYPGIGEYLGGTVKCAPADLVVETRVPGLGFVPGDGRMPFMANIKYPQKQALRRFVRALQARYVLLDLSAGTAFNTLDLFLEANCGIVVTTSEHPAIMSTMVFLKSLVLRAIDQSLRRDPSLTEKLKELYKQSVKDPVFSVARFQSQLLETNPDAAAEIEAICRRLRPRFLYNMMEELNDTEIFGRIDQTLEELLAIEGDHLGVVPYDSTVRKWLKQPGIFKIEAPGSAVSQSINRISQRIIRYWDMPLRGSAESLRERVTEYAPTLFGERIDEKTPSPDL